MIGDLDKMDALASFTSPGGDRTSLGRTLWSLDFWPKRQTDSVCPGENVYLQTGHTGQSVTTPGWLCPEHAPSQYCV